MEVNSFKSHKFYLFQSNVDSEEITNINLARENDSKQPLDAKFELQTEAIMGEKQPLSF